MTSQSSNPTPQRERFERCVLLLLALGLGLIGVALCLPYWPQDQSYHAFADDRELLGVPNCLNVLSNAPFVAVGTLGWLFLLRQSRPFPDGAFLSPRERTPYFVFFSGLVLTGFGSAYYHLDPDNDRLVWDRLPIAVSFMSFFAAMIGERVSPRTGRYLLVPLLLFGAGGVLNWYWGEQARAGNLTVYIVVQFFPVVAIPWMTWLFPTTYTRTADIWQTLGWYMLAKVFELHAFDHGIYDLGHLVSGHTLKHLAAALGAYWILRMLGKRRPLAS
jgi:hypothetical protein